MVREYMNMDEVVAIMQCVQPQGCRTRNLLLKLYGSEKLVTFTCCSTSLVPRCYLPMPKLSNGNCANS